MIPCPDCGKEYKRKDHLVSHRHDKHGVDNAVIVDPPEEPEFELIQGGTELDTGLTVMVDPDTGTGGSPFVDAMRNPERVRQRAEEARRAALQQMPAALAAVPEAPVPTPVHVVAEPPTVSPAHPTQRRHLDQVRFRAKNGYPDPQDSLWLLKRVEQADQIINFVAQPHVISQWNEALSE